MTEQTREAVEAWIASAQLTPGQFLFPSRIDRSPHLSTRQYARIVKSWVAQIGLDPLEYGTHSLRRTRATLIYKRTRNLRAVPLQPGHTKLESTARYLGIEVDDTLEMSEQTEVQAMTAQAIGLAGCSSPINGQPTGPGNGDWVLRFYFMRTMNQIVDSSKL